MVGSIESVVLGFPPEKLTVCVSDISLAPCSIRVAVGLCAFFASQLSQRTVVMFQNQCGVVATEAKVVA